MPPQSAGPALQRVVECPSLATPDTPGIAGWVTCDRPVTGKYLVGELMAAPRHEEETMGQLHATTIDAGTTKAQYERSS
jgi:hypothetical protein